MGRIKDFGRFVISPGFHFWWSLARIYKFWFKEEIKVNLWCDVSQYDVFLKNEKIIEFPKEHNQKGYELLEKIGIPINSKWVCIHNRDSKYLKEKFPKQVWNYHNYRDFSINDMISAAEYFTKNGFYVVRLGAITDEKLNTKNKMIIDYANHESRSDFGDIFLSANCEFYFGSDAGAWKMSQIFRKPGFRINAFFSNIYLFPWPYPAIFKRVCYIENSRELSIKDIIEKEIINVGESEVLRNKGVKLISNTSDEILDLAKEAVKIVNSANNLIHDEKKNELFKILKNDKNMKKMYIQNPIGKSFLESINLGKNNV